MIKKISFLILLLINFNNNIISMQASDSLNNNFNESDCNSIEKNESVDLTQNSIFLILPKEIRQYIIEQLIDTDNLDDLIKRISNAKDIFELYSLDVMNFENVLMNFKKELVVNLKNIALVSYQLKCSVQNCINNLIKYYTYKLKNTFQEKDQKFRKEIKDNYSNYSKNQLNIKLEGILNKKFLNESYLEEIALLIIAGADVNLKNNTGDTALIWLTYYGHSNAIKLLLNHRDIDINIQDNYFGKNALMLAAIKGYRDIIELFLKCKDINVNLVDNMGYNALIWAAFNGYKDIVDLLLNHKSINVNIKDKDGRTALIWAVSQDNKEIVELLLNHKGIDVNIKDSNGKTALIWAQTKEYKDIADLIKSKIDKEK